MMLQIDNSTVEEKESGVASVVYRALSKDQGQGQSVHPRYIAIKSATSTRKFSPEPHDIIKEISVLKLISHVNVIELLDSRSHDGSIEMWTAWISYNLENILDSPLFSPNPLPPELVYLFPSKIQSPLDGSSVPETQDPSQRDIFVLLSKSIIYQLTSALCYLHGLDPPVAHRDIKPRNVLIDETGCVKLIDFGIAYHKQISANPQNLWPENVDKMYCDVATGPFRAPELLFGTKSYDACATDLWSLGCTIAHFFTPIRLLRKSYSYYDDDDEGIDEGTPVVDKDGVLPAYVYSKDTNTFSFSSVEWMRLPLFDGRRGEIGLAWSIFKLRGTPCAENWPDFEELPDANKVQFTVVPATSLRARLPNLPSDSGKEGENGHAPLEIIDKLLAYPPKQRLKSSEVLHHSWFLGPDSHSPHKSDQYDKEGDEGATDPIPVILPDGHPAVVDGSTCGLETRWREKELSYWLQCIVG